MAAALIGASCGSDLSAACEPSTGRATDQEALDRVGGQVQEPASVAAWRADLDCLADALRAQHPNPFFSLSEEEFAQSLDRIRGEIPRLNDYEIVLELSKLVASVSAEGRDGHTHLHLLGGSLPMPQSLFPLRLHWFSDGIFVIDAMDPHEDFIGAEVIAIDGTPVEEITRTLEPAVSGDSNMDRRGRVPWLLSFSEILHAAGLTQSVDRAEWTLRQRGEDLSVRISTVEGGTYWSWANAAGPRPMIPAPGTPPLYLSKLEEDFWFTFLEEGGTLFIQYNAAARETQSGQSLQEFARGIERFVAENPVERVAVDLRHNTGGDNTTYGSLLEVLATDAVDRPGRLFAIIGRYTLSAGINFAAELEGETTVLFVGESSGGSPNQYGDAEPVALPNSHIVVDISTRFHQRSDADDPRLSIEPDIPAASSSEHFFANRDPALEAILAHEPES